MAGYGGRRPDPYRKFRFRVDVPGFDHMGFSKVGGLNEESGTVDYREGDMVAVPRKLMGRTTYEDVTLERGAGPANDFRLWRQDVFRAENGGDADAEACRKEVTVTLMDKQGNDVRRWVLHSAWPRRIEVEEMDASTDDVLIEKIILANEGVEEILLAG